MTLSTVTYINIFAGLLDWLARVFVWSVFSTVWLEGTFSCTVWLEAIFSRTVQPQGGGIYTPRFLENVVRQILFTVLIKKSSMLAISGASVEK